ncbi:hypothetical protein MFLO_14532 [Listeria floridensis FSL S10-1187]|uniref:Uncharacterized protein n=1 Tax=Listeria floridensis FSL S10-1187 TaxID=1265817 RepID=A0ABP3AVU6_9LIST|nr:hypothetical protein [Listeria floridensis]EUJ25980.1 hypothetical protein MFLO_14532 [Listeria floridensis FSL S10-1187]
MQISLNLHTIILFFGSNSSFIQKSFLPALQDDEPAKNYHTSSRFFNRTEIDMQSFEVELDAASLFPNAADYILLDMPANMVEKHNRIIQQIAKKNHYKIAAVFVDQIPQSHDTADYSIIHQISASDPHLSVETNSQELKRYLLPPEKKLSYYRRHT